MKNLRLEDLPSAMEIAIGKLLIMEEELSIIRKLVQPKESNELLTREETAKYLKISLSTLWHWSKKGILPSYGIGNRVYYKISEIESSLTKIN